MTQIPHVDSFGMQEEAEFGGIEEVDPESTHLDDCIRDCH